MSRALVVFALLAGCIGCTPSGGGGGAGGSGTTGGSGGAGGGGTTGGRASGGAGGTSSTGGSGAGSGGTSPSGGTGGAGAGGSGAGTGGAGSGTGGGAGAGGSAGSSGGGAGGGAPDAAPDMQVGMPLTGNGCAGGACLNPTCKPLGTAAPVEQFPEIGFEPRPSYIPKDVIIPTFDDVPDRVWTMSDKEFPNFGDGDWTRKLLDFLDANNLHLDFFINTANFCDLGKYPQCADVVRRLVKTQNVANHTVHHMHMGGNTPPNPMDLAASSCGGPAAMYKCEDEIVGVVNLVKQVSNGGIAHLTRLRAPYGEPFQGGGGADLIKPLVAKYAIHIGWQMGLDSGDAGCDSCNYTGQKIADTIIGQIGSAPGQGNWGIVLMHGTYKWSYEAAQILLHPQTGYLAMKKFRVGTVEDVVCWKYGKHSWEIIQQVSGQKRDPN